MLDKMQEKNIQKLIHNKKKLQIYIESNESFYKKNKLSFFNFYKKKIGQKYKKKNIIIRSTPKNP
jgi:hypothetical protein